MNIMLNFREKVAIQMCVSRGMTSHYDILSSWYTLTFPSILPSGFASHLVSSIGADEIDVFMISNFIDFHISEYLLIDVFFYTPQFHPFLHFPL